MCFYESEDYDWIANVVRETDRLADRPTKCQECGGKIPLGAPIHEVFQQQHELCQICQDDVSENYIGDPDEDSDEESQRQKRLANHVCQYGETYLYRRCESCSQLLDAIEKYEENEGCPPHSRRPALCELRDVFTEHQDAYAYAEAAVGMFPQLWSHPFIVDLLD